MNYISTKELAEKWQMSISRVVRLAKADRIPGARLVGKSWVFPADVKKPCDNRRKENKTAALSPVFRFPLYLYSMYSIEEISHSFTSDERSLYEAEQLFFSGEYQKCHDSLKALLSVTSDLYVRFGALYHICLTCVYLHRCGPAFSYYNQIHSLYLNETAHRNEIGFLIHDLDSYFIGNSYYIEEFSVNMQTEYPAHMREYLILECAYSDMLKKQYKGIPVCPDAYEVVLLTGYQYFSPLSALLMHLYLASICVSGESFERSIFHIREACRIAEEHDLEYSSIAFMSKYLPGIYAGALQDQNPAQLTRLKVISAMMFESFHYLFEYAGKSSLIHVLNPKDSILISFAVKGMTNKEIAAVLNCSVNTVSKKYSLLLEKTETHSKKELADLYIKSIKDY